MPNIIYFLDAKLKAQQEVHTNIESTNCLKGNWQKLRLLTL